MDTIEPPWKQLYYFGQANFEVVSSLSLSMIFHWCDPPPGCADALMLRYWRFRIELFSDRCVCMSVTRRPSHQFKFTGIWKYSPPNIKFCLLLSKRHLLGKVLCCKFNLHLCSAGLQTSFYVMFNISQNIWFSYATAYSLHSLFNHLVVCAWSTFWQQVFVHMF